MNPRIIKKLSKRAAPLLPLLGYKIDQFKAEKGGNYHGLLIRDRRYWERVRCHPSYTAIEASGERITKSRAGHIIALRPPVHPLKGTVMVGGISGYYEPEWDEECAWGALYKIVVDSFCDYDEEKEELIPTRVLRTPSDILRAAEEMIIEGTKP